jgi:hypothetical protein
MAYIEIPVEDRVDRTGLLELQQNSHKKWALFVRGSNASSAKFKFVFDNQFEAYEKAKEFAVKRFSDGSKDFTFYIIEIKQMLGIENGKIVDLELK